MPDAPRVLGFSTAGPYCGAALFAGNDVIAARHEDLAKGQAERLMPMIQEVLAEAGTTVQDLDAIGVGTGPGNFTGIRISVSAARGLALGLGIPAVGVSLLEALVLGQDGPVLASIAAGRDHFYLQRFADGAGRGPELVAKDDLAGWAHPGLTCIGQDAAEIAAGLDAAHASPAFQPASAVARLAAQRYDKNPPRPAPLYLRPADAAPARDTAPPLLT
ncbi:MAG: tRNA (adenosine(37)-N6)-threonylcarbamoyltransferase complex dimerization subunit type 1 TsaB [Sulfitobacter sp.]|nr:tRNA (adenosine(37)-N6)-threonylcarbamoyltransferase complex dimerization subunit type 1 TsaB [Sulfitobacter sp.]